MANSTEPPSHHVQACGYLVLPPLNTSDPVVVQTAIVNCILNTPTALLALLANTVVLLAFTRDRTLRSNANFLLAWLAVTDVIVGGVVQPLFIASHVEILLNRRSCGVNLSYDALKFLSSMMSVMTALYISIDRCFAVTIPFKYSTWVTTKRIFIALMIPWAFWTAIIASWTFGAAGAILQLSCVCFMILTFVILAAIYAKMIKLAQQHLHQIVSQRRAGQNTVNRESRRHIKALRTAVFVIGTLMICYLPITIVVLLFISVGFGTRTGYVAVSYAETVLFVCSAVDPIIYCLRSREIRNAVLKVLERGAAGTVWQDDMTRSYPSPRNMRTLMFSSLGSSTASGGGQVTKL